MTNTQEFNGVTINGERRTKANTGYGVYIGKRRMAWSISSDEAVRLAVEAVKKERTKNRFVPTVTVFDQAQILNIALITDDANGITISRPNYGGSGVHV